MDERVLMGGVERAAHLVEDEQRPCEPERPALLEHLPQVAAFDVAHRDVEAAVVLAGVVDGDDVRVVEARCEVGFLQETIAEVLISVEEPRGQDLERDLPPQPDLLGEVHHAHPSAAEHRFDPEPRDVRTDQGA